MKKLYAFVEMATTYTILSPQIHVTVWNVFFSSSSYIFEEKQSGQCACHAIYSISDSQTPCICITEKKRLRQVRVTCVYDSLISIYNIRHEFSHFWEKTWHRYQKNVHTWIYCFIILFNGYFSSNNKQWGVLFCLFVLFPLIAARTLRDIMTANDQKGNEWQTELMN